MSLKEKMMDNMMSQMSAEEKKELMNSMMEKFFASMSDEEKRGMMTDMMPKMMKTMMGGGAAGGGSSPMAGMMEFMMGRKRGREGEPGEKAGAFNPMDMCGKMMASLDRSNGLAALSTPEVQTLFEDWAAQVQDEIVRAIGDDEGLGLEALAGQLKISRPSLIYFLARLAQREKIDLLVKPKTP